MKHNLLLLGVLSAWLLCSASLSAQISGTVLEASTGEPIIGASVLEVGTTTGSITDFDGKFTLNVAEGTQLQFSYMGFSAQTLPAKQGMIVRLTEDTYQIQEVVAIGYGSQKKKEVTGSVASVKAEDFNAGVKSNPVGLLQGKVAGLSISRQGSDPTSTGYNIQIRGFSTLGKGTGSSPLYIVDGIPVNNIDNIAPEEIASMDVLKDGSAAAIYGTRGTNGVIIITTKRGSTNGDGAKMQVEYSGYMSVSAPRGGTGMATPEEYRNLETLSNGKVKPVLTDETTNSDWYGEMLRPAALTHSHNVALSGNAKGFGYRGSVAYKGAQGIAKGNDRQEIIAKFAANQKALQGWLELQYDFSYMHYKNQYQCGDFKTAAILNPTLPIYDPSSKSGFAEVGGTSENPIMAQNQKESYQQGNYFRGSVKGSINILPVPGLKLNVLAALEEGDNYSYYYCSQDYSIENETEAGKATRNTDMNLNQLYEATVDYVGSWNSHNLVVVGGFSYQKFFNDGNFMENNGFPTNGYKYYSMGDGQADKKKMNISSYRNSNLLVAGFARINYNYDERYLLSASIRAEGSSRFGANHKWGWFPAASAGWRISGEDWMKDQTWCNDLKLRAGFGVTGNNLGQDLASVELLQKGGEFWYNNEWVSTYGILQNANPDLRWEKKYEYNLGIDFAFLDNRLSGMIDLYYRDTKDLLWEYDVPTPPYLFNKLLANAGEIASKGIEISLTGVPVKTKDWEWSSTWTMAFNNNKITKLSDPSKGFNYTEQLSGSVWEEGKANTNTQIIIEGQSVGTFYGYKVTNITDKGTLVYEKWTQDDVDAGLCAESMKGKNKLQVIGNAQPVFTYGWNNSIRWRDLDITLFFRGNVGNDVFNVKRWAFAPRKTSGNNIFMKDVQLLADGKGAYNTGNFSDYYLEDGSFLKLDNITVGYTFHFKNNKYIQSLRLHATAENVFTITKYSGIDPDVNTSDVWNSGIDATGFYPSVSNVIVGLNITL